MLEKGVWLNEPKVWNLTTDQLTVATDAGSDFWQKTHYGFVHDSGHFFAHNITGDFTAQIHVKACYKSLYDQAGLMIRVDENTWIKIGIELSDGELMLGSVLTIGSSDWATGAFTGGDSGVWLRVTLVNGVMKIQWSDDGKRWPLLRLCNFPDVETYQVGPMCCSPITGGMNADFSAFSINPPLYKDLHDLS